MKLLSSKRSLVIVDNYETVEDSRIEEFLGRLPGSTKALITTRERLTRVDAIRLSGMNKTESFNLIDHTCTEKEVPFLNQEEKLLLYERTGGVPLAIWLDGKVRKVKPDPVTLASIC